MQVSCKRSFLEITKILHANIAAESVALPDNFNSDSADCIIIASTREIAGTLITRDNKIIEWAKRGFIKFQKG